MLITVRRSDERGRADHGWLDARHTFSFADYHDPRHVRFRSLRVLNEDRIAPGGAFPPHDHSDMEIVTCILEGNLRHKDSMGNGSVLRPGDVQRMTAGTGVRHSEENASMQEPLHLFQVWILPERRDLEPGYEERNFPAGEKEGGLRLLVSPDGRDGSLRIHQDASIYAAVLAPGGEVVHRLGPARHAWIQVASGAVAMNGETLREGDGASLSREEAVTLAGIERGETLLFDLS